MLPKEEKTYLSRITRQSVMLHTNIISPNTLLTIAKKGDAIWATLTSHFIISFTDIIDFNLCLSLPKKESQS